ncbi:MAG: SCO family protein [Phycisphaerae bacterium]
MSTARSHRFGTRIAGVAFSVACLTLWTACATGRVASSGPAASAPASETKTAAPDCCAKKSEANAAQRPSANTRLDIPDAQLITHDGKSVRLFTDLIKGRTVAINTFFTSCTTICPPLMATVARVQQTLLDQGRDDIQLISISVDPTTDTPRRLNVWSRNFDAKPGWTMLTGDKATVNRVLKALQSFTPDFQDHSPMILIGNESTNAWKQVYGLAPAAKLADAILDVAGPKPPATQSPATAAATDLDQPNQRAENTPARNYFTDVELIDQNGKTWRLYSDLMRGRTVVVDSFFSSCKGVCPVLNQKMTAIAKTFPEQMGKDLLLLSISVDPQIDTPARLYEYAQGLHAGPGWLFLTGSRENLKIALSKFGMYVDNREDHSNLVMIGNDATGLWKKAFGLAPDDKLLELVTEVVNDRNPDTGRASAANRAGH